MEYSKEKEEEDLSSFKQRQDCEEHKDGGTLLNY